LLTIGQHPVRIARTLTFARPTTTSIVTVLTTCATGTSVAIIALRSTKICVASAATQWAAGGHPDGVAPAFALSSPVRASSIRVTTSISSGTTAASRPTIGIHPSRISVAFTSAGPVYATGVIVSTSSPIDRRVIVVGPPSASTSTAAPIDALRVVADVEALVPAAIAAGSHFGDALVLAVIAEQVARPAIWALRPI